MLRPYRATTDGGDVTLIARSDTSGRKLNYTGTCPGRGAVIERQVETTFRTQAALTDARDVVVTCTITQCEVVETTGTDPATAQSALRRDGLLKAMAALGSSSGPDEEAASNGGTAFVMYLNREI